MNGNRKKHIQVSNEMVPCMLASGIKEQWSNSVHTFVEKDITMMTFKPTTIVSNIAIWRIYILFQLIQLVFW